MNIRIAAVLILAALAAAVPCSASAEYLMSESMTASFARSDVTTRYMDVFDAVLDDSAANVSCRPSKLARHNPHKGKLYHRWVCDWQVTTLKSESCTGREVIAGSATDHDNSYYRATILGARCTAPE